MEEVTEKGYKKSTEAAFSTVKPVSVTDAIYNASLLADQGTSRVLPRQVATGTYHGQQAVGGQNAIIDAAGGRFIVNDGVNNRFVAGLRGA